MIAPGAVDNERFYTGMGHVYPGAPRRHGLGRHRPDAESGVSDAAGRIDAWLAELAGQRRQSVHTIAPTGATLPRFIELAGLWQPGSSRRSSRITSGGFVAQLHARGLSGRSLARVLSGMARFIRGWPG